MKKIVQMLAVVLIMALMTLTMTSCFGERLSGSYELAIASDGLGGWVSDAINSQMTYTFKGSKVTIEVVVMGHVTTMEGKYKIEEDQITFTFDSEKEDADKYEGTKTFEKLENGNIKIGGVEYTPVKDDN